MQCRFQASGSAGYERIAGSDTGLKYFGEYGILRLDGVDRFEDDTGPNEVFLHLVEGVATIRTGSFEKQLGERMTAFDGKPAAVYLPPGTHYSVIGSGP